ncbi:hypothetical protein [Azospirillum sp. B506]|uniref:hypothetical protein n=1 Tax=Azospirillum sp. B506 TaxID=137721 RepID=UPI00034A1EAA|nr:hypothetical protein [Azospirillum sp. B506]
MSKSSSPIRAGAMVFAMAFVGLASTAGHTARFVNSFIAFEAPSGWTCSLEGPEDVAAWVCVDAAQAGTRDAIIVLTAKHRGDGDRLDLYQDHLSTPRAVSDSEGRPTGRMSRVKFVREDIIADHSWVHGRHYESEVPGYVTDYFATVKNDIAIVVTFSAHQSVFDLYYARFYPSMATIEARSPLP